MRRRSAWEVSSDPTTSFDVHDDMHVATTTGDDCPPHLLAAIRESAAHYEREMADLEARDRVRREEDARRYWERVMRERRCG